MRIRELLFRTKASFGAAGIDSPYLDAMVLLADAMGLSTADLLARLPDSVPPRAVPAFHAAVERRLAGVPVAYIRGRKEFFGLDFRVDARVLVPRPDTEILVETALGLAAEVRGVRPDLPARIHDACTGSGCVAVALAHGLGPRAEVTASDLSAATLEVFDENCRRLLGRRLPWTESDSLGKVAGVFDLITANPPYLTTKEAAALAERSWPEPGLALDGGRDGLEVSRRLVVEAWSKLVPGGYLVMETADALADQLAGAFARAGFLQVAVSRDLADLRRVVHGRRG